MCYGPVEAVLSMCYGLIEALFSLLWTGGGGVMDQLRHCSLCYGLVEVVLSVFYGPDETLFFLCYRWILVEVVLSVLWIGL